MIAFYKDLYAKISHFLFNNNPFTWVYGLSRTILAIGTLITLLFSSSDVLFDYEHFNGIDTDTFLNSINLFLMLGWENLIYAKIIGVVVMILVVSGYYPRITGILQWWVASSYFHSSNILEGGDQINAIITFLLIPITLLDHRKSHWQVSENYTPTKKFIGNLMLILISVQMAMVYLNALTEKMYAQTDEWKIGNAFYYYANDSYFSYPDWMDPLMEQLLANSFIISSITWGTLFLELVLFGVLFSNKKVKLAVLPLGILFHFLIIVFFGLVSFFFNMLGGLILYLVPTNMPKKWSVKSYLSSLINKRMFAKKST